MWGDDLKKFKLKKFKNSKMQLGAVGKRGVLWFRARRKTGQEALSLDNPVDVDYSQLLLTTGFFSSDKFRLFN